MPVDAGVLREQVVAPLGGGHVPTRLSPVQEHRVAAPAVRDGVVVPLGSLQQPALVEFGHDPLVGVSHALSHEPRDRGREPPVLADGIERREPKLLADLAVDLPEGG